jgi:ABC-type polysaccharide/polyol phosphate export permease
MSNAKDDNDVDLNRIIVRTIYFGLVINILSPMVLFLACYYIQGHGGRDNVVGDAANLLFYFFAGLAIAQAGVALWWRKKRLQWPMVRNFESFEEDIASGLIAACRPVFVVIAAITLYGFIYYFLTGRFTEMVVYIFFSFIVFQFVRPRLRLARRIIVQQRHLVNKGRFRQG